MGAGRRRPMSPVECAEAIQRLIDEEHGSPDKVSEGLGKPNDMSNMYKKHDTTMITLFLNLLKVSKKSRDLTGWITDDWPLIPFSIIAQLSTMTPEEQDIIQSILGSKDKKNVGQRRCQEDQKMAE